MFFIAPDIHICWIVKIGLSAFIFKMHIICYHKNHLREGFLKITYNTLLFHERLKYYPHYVSRSGIIIYSKKFELLLISDIFYDTISVRAIEVRLYSTMYSLAHITF